MNILVELVHPAHFYYYRDTIANLKRDGHKVIVAIVTKDVLEDVVRQSGVEYVNICPKPHKKYGKIGVAYDMVMRDLRMLWLAVRHRVDIITGSTIETAHIGWLLRKPNINIGEDDAAVVMKYIKQIKPFVGIRLTPDCTDNGPIEPKSIHFPGYYKTAYLRPGYFTADAAVPARYGVDVTKPYFLIRFSALNAHHDKGIKGISNEIAQRLIDILEGSGLDHFESPNPTASPTGLDHFESDPSQLVPFSSNSSPNNSTKGTSLTPSEACSLSPSACSLSADSGNKLVPQNSTDSSLLVPLSSNSPTTNSTSGNKPRIYITSERPLEPQFEKYRIKINPLDMHHVMAFASLYIGDSQTMAAEAGVLGVPFVRFNDFVGRIGYLRELEDVYELGYGIHATPLTTDSPIRRNDGSPQPSGVDALYHRVSALVSMPPAERRTLFQSRRQTMLSDKIDCAKFLTWFIEHYPESASLTRKADAEFWKRFK